MGDLSKNFSASEFECPCADCKLYLMDFKLIQGLQAVRDDIGVQIRVLSGYRCAAHNEAVGGSERSFHMHGKAADIHAPDIDFSELKKAVMKVPAFINGGIGLYPGQNFIHCDVRGYKARFGK